MRHWQTEKNHTNVSTLPLAETQQRGRFNIFSYLFFDLQAYVNLEVYDGKDYANFDVMTQND